MLNSEKQIFTRTPLVNKLVKTCVYFNIKYLLISAFIFSFYFGFSQNDSVKKEKIILDSLTNTLQIKEKVKKGLNFGGLPIIGFDSDLGFRYGVTASLFHYGDGKIYPEYLFNIYLEINLTTRGYWNNEIFFDSKRLLPWNLRLTADFAYVSERNSDFYGFNGYNSYYNDDFENKKDSKYISKVFYSNQRKMYKATFDFQRKIKTEKLKWVFGLGYYGIETAPVDVERYNRDRTEDTKIKDTTTLFDNYVKWNLIPEDVKNGGNTVFTKLGLIFDTRDNEPNPWKGLWTELTVLYAPAIFGIKQSYTQLQFIHRQYFTLVKKYLSFAYRLGYQTELTGNIPFYMQPFVINSYYTQDGLGGSKNLRGIRRNRVVGKGITYGNVELRYRFVKFNLFKQNFYSALSAFCDAGMVVKKNKFDRSAMTDEEISFVEHDPESLHISYGAGWHIVMNRNFILTFNYGMPVDKRDGDYGFYLGVNFLF